MNRNLSKLLQSLAGVVIFSMASLSMAASYTYDFDADEHERGGQPLVFDDLSVYGGLLVDGVAPDYDPTFMRANAYLDAGTKSGLGVCKGSVKDDDFGAHKGTNKCYSAD